MSDEIETRDLLASLHFIAKIKGGEKIDIKTLTLSPDSLFLQLYRTLFRWGAESRESTYKFIEEIIDRALETSKRYLKVDNNISRNIGKTLIDAVESSKIGINEIKKTYLNDKHYISKLEAFIQLIDIKLGEIKKLLITESIPIPVPRNTPSNTPPSYSSETISRSASYNSAPNNFSDF